MTPGITHRLRVKTRPPGLDSHEEHAHDAVSDPDPQDLPNVRFRIPEGPPSERQRFEHSITHLPFQTWCLVCVGAR